MWSKMLTIIALLTFLVIGGSCAVPAPTPGVFDRVETVVGTPTERPTLDMIPGATAVQPTPSAEPAPAIITASEVTTDEGTQVLSLELSLNIPSEVRYIEEIIYYSVEKPSTGEQKQTTFWRAKVQDVNDRRVIAEIPYARDLVPEQAILSPNKQWIAYGLAYDAYLDLEILNLDGKKHRQLDTRIDALRNVQAFLWTADSSSLVYTKKDDHASHSAVYRARIATGAIELLWIEDGIILPLGLSRDDLNLYYAWYQWGSKKIFIKEFNFAQEQNRILTIIEGDRRLNYGALSPDKQQIVVNVGDKPYNTFVISIDLEKMNMVTNNLRYDYLVWTPDGQNLVAGNDKFLSWSPDGKYLAYRRVFHSEIQNGYVAAEYLVNLEDGVTQQFPKTTFGVAGWLER